MCGEQSHTAVDKDCMVGSPPRVRGTVASLPCLPLKRRITPACAGNSFQSLLPRVKLEDHPRVCGEQRYRTHGKRAKSGSPPRVRGTAHAPTCLLSRGRITPACAGNSPFAGWLFLPEWDHPRVCGEQLACFCFCLTYKGSPPRVRGTGNKEKLGEKFDRITPACAGNSNVTRLCPSRFQDHPRVCGEQGLHQHLPYQG